MERARIEDWWPAAGVRARAGDLHLRWIDDRILERVAALAADGIHPPDRMPFAHPWTRGTAGEVARNVVLYQWAARSQVGPDRMALELAVVERGRVVGVQSIVGEHWGERRELETGSWLGLPYQGRGIGTRMRALMLELCFDGLGAAAVTSTAFADNAASCAVSRAVGYERDGSAMIDRDGIPTLQNHYRITRPQWLAVRARNAALLGGRVALSGTAALREAI